MTKKQVRRNASHGKSKKTTIKFLEQQPVKFAAAICPINLEEQKERFLKHGKLPQFVMKGSEDEIEDLYNKTRNQIRFDLIGEAQYVLTMVKEKFGDSENYLTHQFGEKISKEVATEMLGDYIKENGIDGAMSIIFCNDLVSAARMMWVGPHVKNNRPEARNYSLWIKNSEENPYLREHGIRCLANHEIGTHFFRMFNDGLQPWFSDRKRFGIRGLSSLEQLRSEEGLAAINTILNAKERYLWGPALLYYTACKAAEMSFKQLFDHLSQYVSSPEQRWRYCMRVKRGLLDLNDIGGYGKDQCYFEGAVEILRNIEKIEFHVFMSGKICIDEIPRCKRIARTDCVKLPSFMRNEKRYKKLLLGVANVNGLHLRYPDPEPPLAYIQRLKRGRRIGPSEGSKVRKRCRKWRKAGYPPSYNGSPAESDTSCDYDTGLAFQSLSLGGRSVSDTSQSKICNVDMEKDNIDKRVDSGIVSDIETGSIPGKETHRNRDCKKPLSLIDGPVKQFDIVSDRNVGETSFTSVLPFCYEDSELSCISGDSHGLERCMSTCSVRSLQTKFPGTLTSMAGYPEKSINSSLAYLNTAESNINCSQMNSKIGDPAISFKELTNVESLQRDSGTTLDNSSHLSQTSCKDAEIPLKLDNLTPIDKKFASPNYHCGDTNKLSTPSEMEETSDTYVRDSGTELSFGCKRPSICNRDSGIMFTNYSVESLNNCVRDSGLNPKQSCYRNSGLLPPRPASDKSTTIVVNEEIMKREARMHRNEEVILPRLPAQWHASSFSYLTDINLYNMSGTKDLDSPSFHSCVRNFYPCTMDDRQNNNNDFQCTSVQNVIESGPEKFIYPESRSSQILKLATSGSVKDSKRISLLNGASHCPSASFSKQLPHLFQRRAKSAICRSTATPSTCYNGANDQL